MKSILRTILMAGPVMTLAVSAQAAGLKPGLYSADGIQEICLQAAGTWYSPTYGGWGGYWEVVGANTHIWGNYTGGGTYLGYGNDSLVIKGKAGTWTEWTDDLSYNYVGDPITFTKAGKCTASEHHPHVNKANPSQK